MLYTFLDLHITDKHEDEILIIVTLGDTPKFYFYIDGKLLFAKSR